MADDDSQTPPRRPKHLLDELESIKGALSNGRGAQSDAPADIPLLDDMVIDHLDDNAELLNIAQIFDESAPKSAPPMQFPRFTLDVAISDDDSAAPTAAPQPHAQADGVRETLIREIVDEFLPRIETELRRRLRQLDDSALRRLKGPD